ncbi:MAG: DAK2 domain-containing protein, partial [Chloroflexota bacterium]
MNADQAKHVIASMAQTITEHQALLSRLDTTIGDGDHGHNLAKAFAEADSAVQLLEAPDLQTIWRVTGRTIRDSVGGASGLLFGAFFTGAARTLADKDHVSISDFVEMLEAGVAAVQKRGKANPGDKTM